MHLPQRSNSEEPAKVTAEVLIDRRESPEVLRRQKPILRPTSSTELAPEEEEDTEDHKVVYRWVDGEGNRVEDAPKRKKEKM